jgi:hypothetical protein
MQCEKGRAMANCQLLEEISGTIVSKVLCLWSYMVIIMHHGNVKVGRCTKGRYTTQTNGEINLRYLKHFL